MRDRPFLSVLLQNKRPGGVIDCERAINKGRSVIRRRGCSNNDYDVIAATQLVDIISKSYILISIYEFLKNLSSHVLFLYSQFLR